MYDVCMYVHNGVYVYDTCACVMYVCYMFVCVCVVCGVYVFVIYLYVYGCGMCNVCEHICVWGMFMWDIYMYVCLVYNI